MTCTFFGHRDAPPSLAPALQALLTQLIQEQGVTRFLVGNQGRFDEMVAKVLTILQKDFSHISFAIVLAYLPQSYSVSSLVSAEQTLFPMGLETVPPAFAIQRRNLWMLQQADCVVAYVVHTLGNAHKFLHRAQRQGKKVWNLAKME